MCIAIVKPQNTVISDEYLKNSFEMNNDGAGIAYALDNQLYIIKGIFDVKEFIKTVRDVEKIAEGDILIHCRIGTSGIKDRNNCHPHIVNSNLVLIHNGILDIDVPDESEVSDTIIFIQEYLKDLPKDFITNPAILKMIEKVIGHRNKFAFLNNKGESAICNKDEGIWEDGIWYSNDTYKDYFDDSIYSYYELCDYLESLVDSMDANELAFLGDYPLLDLNDYSLIPFSKEAYRNTFDYVSLKKYSKDVFKKYLKRYKGLFETSKQERSKIWV